MTDSPKSYLFIVNPVSGFRKRKRLRRLIRETFSGRSITFQVRKTKGPKHAGILGQQGKENHLDVVVAVGGDGTINEVGQQLVGSKTILGIVPKGSGNGLARFLNIPLSSSGALKVLRDGKTRSIDTGYLDQHLFINMAGIGFDAHIAKAFAGSRRRGFLSYLKLTICEFARYQASEYLLEVEGESIRVRAFLISFANSTQYGSNAHIAPSASIDDGLLDIAVMRPFPVWAAPSIAYRMITRSIHRSPYVDVYQAGEARVQHDKPLVGHVDGEPVQLPHDFIVKINPLSLRVISP